MALFGHEVDSRSGGSQLDLTTSSGTDRVSTDNPIISSVTRTGSDAGGGGGSASVRQRQIYLNHQGANLVVDGISGPATRAAEARYGSGGGSTGSDFSVAGSGYTGGSTYTGGTGYTPSAADNANVDALQARALEASLAQIAAQFGGDIDQQKALLALFQPQLEKYMFQTERDRGKAGDAAADQMVERGIYRSGLTASNIVKARQPFTDAMADATGKYSTVAGSEGTEVRQVRSAIEALNAQQGAAQTSARIASEQGELDRDLYLASLR